MSLIRRTRSSRFFSSSRRRHTRYIGDWSSDVCSSDLVRPARATLCCLGNVTTGAEVRSRSEERSVGKEWRTRGKAVIDEKDGTTTFYVFDTEDPIISAYSRIFTGLVQDAALMPSGLHM